MCLAVCSLTHYLHLPSAVDTPSVFLLSLTCVSSVRDLYFLGVFSWMLVPLAMAPSPQQVFGNQGVLRISGFSFKVSFDRNSSHFLVMSSHFVNYCFWFLLFLLLFLMLFLLFLYLVLLILSGDIESNPGPIKHNFKMFYCNVRGLKANLDDLSVASASFDMICCTETLVSIVLDISRS